MAYRLRQSLLTVESVTKQFPAVLQGAYCRLFYRVGEFRPTELSSRFPVRTIYSRNCLVKSQGRTECIGPGKEKKALRSAFAGGKVTTPHCENRIKGQHVARFYVGDSQSLNAVV